MRPTRRQGGPRHPKRGHACSAPPMSGASRVQPVSGTAPRPWIDWTLTVGRQLRLLGELRCDRPQRCCPASPAIERTPAKGPEFCPRPLLTAISLFVSSCVSAHPPGCNSILSRRVWHPLHMEPSEPRPHVRCESYCVARTKTAHRD
jgi:hypothetical protein